MIENGRRVRFGHYQRKNYFKFRVSGKSADFPETHFHGRGRRGNRHLQRRFLRKCGAAVSVLALSVLAVHAKLPVSPEALPLGELSPKVTERARPFIEGSSVQPKTGRCGMQQPGKSMRASQKPYAVRGKGSTSRMFWMPVRYMIMRSKPKP